MSRQYSLVKAEAFAALSNRLVATMRNLMDDLVAYPIGDRILTFSEGYCYEVVASGEHIETAAGVKLRLLPDGHGRYNAQGLDIEDIGEACNLLFADIGDDCHVHIGAPATETGKHLLGTTIDMSQSVGKHLKLSGDGRLNTTLEMPAGSAMIGINAQDSDEVTIEGLRIIEGSGSQTCLCVLVGGTSAVVEDVWAGNAKIGLVHGGADAHWYNIWVEACLYGLIVASRFCDFSVGMTTPVVSVTSPRFHQVYIYNCGSNNVERKPGLYVTHFRQANISSVAGTFQVGETVTGGTSGSTGIIFSSNGTDTLILEDAFDAFTASETITGGTSGATATLDSTNMNVVRAAQFTACELANNDRHGAIIEGGRTLHFQGVVKHNGTNASSETAGIVVGPDADLTLVASLIDNGPQAGAGAGYGLILDGSGATVKALGGDWTNEQYTDQDYAFKRASGTLTLCGVNVAGNALGVKSGTSLHTARGCLGTPDSNVNLGSEEVDKTTSHSVVDVNAETDTLVSAKAISAGDVHVWRIWQISAAGTLQSLRKLVVHNNAGTISGTDVEDFDTGTSSAAIVDNANGTYDVTVTNGSANDRDFFARLEEVIDL